MVELTHGVVFADVSHMPCMSQDLRHPVMASAILVFLKNYLKVNWEI